jgi:GNAT superfamily N-acetyltransferase
VTHPPLNDPQYQRALDESLVLRWSASDDAERIGKLYSFVFRNKADAPPNHRMVTWTHDLLNGRHPLHEPSDFALVEDARTGTIVAATCLISQTWEYSGVPFPVGRPEIVATLPEYRNRGLIRAIFELIHARSAAKGHMVQGITGIPYYYRQFGYEYAVDLGGGRDVPFAQIPARKEGEDEPFALRPATVDDLPQVMTLYDRERARATVSTRLELSYWRYVLEEQNPASGEGWNTRIISDVRGNTLGYVLTRRVRWDDSLAVVGLAVVDGVSYLEILPSVLRGLQVYAEQVPARAADVPPVSKLRFMLGRHHPLYEVLGTSLAPGKPEPYAWYVRVPDVPAFLMHVRTVLEARLAASAVAGHTSELRIDFYRGGLKLTFERGRLKAAVPWRRGHNWEAGGQCGFPPLVFLQLLFGHRRLDELRYAFADVWADSEARPLLEALFPPRLAWVLPLE